MNISKCRHCKNLLKDLFIDLDYAPPSNAYLSVDDLADPELYFPLKVYVCNSCYLVQTKDFNSPESLFDNEYAYLSSASDSWKKHALRYCEMITSRLDLKNSSLVIEAASNDGYLLENFVRNDIPCLGIEPTKSTADLSKKRGINTLQKFLTAKSAKEIIKEYGKADLVIGNNVYAHVPKINDFTKALKILIKKRGIITLEFPHLLNLIKFNQFDTIYHEHFSYLSLSTVKRIFETNNLKVFDVEKLSTHGGSLRIYGTHSDNGIRILPSVQELLLEEKKFGLSKMSTYANFQSIAESIRLDFLDFLINAKKSNKTVCGYGAAAKGNTLINFASVKNNLIDFVVDNSELKQNKYLPGSHIPIISPKDFRKKSFDYLIIFPWNIYEEITNILPSFNFNYEVVRFIPKLEKTKIPH